MARVDSEAVVGLSSLHVDTKTSQTANARRHASTCARSFDASQLFRCPLTCSATARSRRPPGDSDTEVFEFGLALRWPLARSLFRSLRKSASGGSTQGGSATVQLRFRTEAASEQHELAPPGRSAQPRPPHSPQLGGQQ